MKLYDSVLRRVRMVEEKNGIRYAKADGRLYKTLKVIYSVIGLYAAGINLLFIAGMLLTYSGTDNFKNIMNSLITVSVCTGLMILGYVLSFFKFKLTAGIISVFPELFLIPVFGVIMKDDLGFFGFIASYFWRHLIPLALLAILMTWQTVICVRARLKTEKQYKKVMENLYSLYNVSAKSDDISDITDEQWESFLKSYDPSDYTALFKAKEQPDSIEN